MNLGTSWAFPALRDFMVQIYFFPNAREAQIFTIYRNNTRPKLRMAVRTKGGKGGCHGFFQ
jgi:hypothetical protein